MLFSSCWISSVWTTGFIHLTHKVKQTGIMNSLKSKPVHVCAVNISEFVIINQDVKKLNIFMQLEPCAEEKH